MLPVRFLDDDFVQPGDYPDWPSACWVIKNHREDRAVLEELLVSLPRDGFEEPVWLQVRTRDMSVFVTDGHHRCVAAFELGLKEIPYRWSYRPRYGRTEYEREPIPEWIFTNLEVSRA